MAKYLCARFKDGFCFKIVTAVVDCLQLIMIGTINILSLQKRMYVVFTIVFTYKSDVDLNLNIDVGNGTDQMT